MSSQNVIINESTNKKRKRGKNFTELEVRFLVDLIIQNINIIENKKTDAVTWKDKEKIWNQISQEFQALTGTNRTSSVLRSKYDGIKHTIKSKISKNKTEIFKTGGGAAQITDLTDYENKLLGYIQVNVQGLPNKFDSDYEISIVDIACPSNSLDGNAVQVLAEYETTTNTEMDSIAQANNEPGPPVAEYIEFEINTNVTNMPNSEQTLEPINIEHEMKKCDVQKKWNNWNPKLLKDKKHKKLMLPKRSTKDELNSKLEMMVENRENMLKVQTEAIKKEVELKQQQLEAQEEFQIKERELKLQLLEHKLEKQKLAIQLIKKQLGSII